MYYYSIYNKKQVASHIDLTNTIWKIWIYAAFFVGSETLYDIVLHTMYNMLLALGVNDETVAKYTNPTFDGEEGPV